MIVLPYLNFDTADGVNGGQVENEREAPRQPLAWLLGRFDRWSEYLRREMLPLKTGEKAGGGNRNVHIVV